jgi:hypothetical protein
MPTLAAPSPPASSRSRTSSSPLRFRAALPWLVFGGGFLLTTGIGATIIGLSQGDRWGLDATRHHKLLIDTTVLLPSVYASHDYWLVLALCLLVPTAGVAWTLVNTPRPLAAQPQRDDRRVMAVSRLVFLVITCWLLGRIAFEVSEPFTTIKGAWSGDLAEHYRVRGMVTGTLKSYELGFAYMGLLALLALPLRRALVTGRNRRAWIELLLWCLVYGLLALVLVQKLLISFALLLCAFSLCTMRNVVVQWRRLILIGVAFFCVVHLAMSTLLPGWSAAATIDHLIGRSADSYPYAIAVGPHHPFSVARYLLGSVLVDLPFFASSAGYNHELYSVMYPATTGAVALAAPVWSYSDVGIPGTVLSLLVVGTLCAFASRLSRFIDNSLWAWAVFLLLLLELYILTQVPLAGILFWSYGMAYGFVALGLVRVLAAARFRRRATSTEIPPDLYARPFVQSTSLPPSLPRPQDREG